MLPARERQVERKMPGDGSRLVIGGADELTGQDNSGHPSILADDGDPPVRGGGSRPVRRPRAASRPWNHEPVKLYSDFGPRRAWQVFFDLTCVLFIVAWVWFGATIYRLVDDLAAFGEHMEVAGADFSERMTEIGEALGNVFAIGAAIRVPFDGAGEAGHALEEAGQSQQDAIHQLALTLGIGIAVLPIFMIVVVWLLTRFRFARRAGRAKALLRAGAGLDLLALRALTNQRITTIAKVDPDAMGAWRRGDEVVMRKLAAIELENAGIRLPA